MVQPIAPVAQEFRPEQPGPIDLTQVQQNVARRPPEKRAKKITTASARAQAIEDDAPILKKKTRGARSQALRQLAGYKELPPKQRRMLFLNIGDGAIRRATNAVRTGSTLPPWAKMLGREKLLVRKGKLYYDGKVFLLKAEKADVVKRCYFNPKKPATQAPIYEHLRGRYANLRRSDVVRALKGLETYQRNFPRRRPPKSGFATFTFKTPGGIIAIDTFYPSKKLHGWHGKYSVLCVVDAWSRFSRAYACTGESAEVMRKALKRFLTEFAGMGHLPRRIMADRGSELHMAKGLMEKYRRRTATRRWCCGARPGRPSCWSRR